ncbi:MAG: FadR/GntR family transcriptional regulator [Myxococcales bacterium]
MTRPARGVLFGLQTVRRAHLSEDVVRQIKEQIALGHLQPGDKLPPERELARKFHIGRSSVRDAMRSLQLMGLVRSRQGAGSVVCDLSADSLVGPLSRALADKRELVDELLDVRGILEPALAARAAQNATAAEIDRLEAILRRQEAKVRHAEPCVEEDSEFHYIIAVAARNSVVDRILDLLMDLLRDSRARGLQAPGRSEKSLAGHERILAAIARHDPGAARAAMLRHLGEVGELIRGAQRSTGQE